LQQASDELKKLADKDLTGTTTSHNPHSSYHSKYNMEQSTLEPKQLYLLNQFMGFDKFTGVEREDLVDLMVDQWMTDPYVGDEYRQHIELYCESSFSIDRRSSEREFPNRLNTAVCCDMLQLIARKETKYRRALKLIKAGIFASIFQDYKEADENGQTFLEMRPYYTAAKQKKEESSRRNDPGEYPNKHRHRDSTRHRNNAQRHRPRQESKPVDKKEMLVSILRDISPSEAAELIESQCGYNYRQKMSDAWSGMDIPTQTPMQDRGATSSTSSGKKVHVIPQPSPPPPPSPPPSPPSPSVQMSEHQINEYLHPVHANPEVHEIDSLTAGRVIPKPDEKVEMFTKEETADALNQLIPTSEGHGQKVLIHAIGTCPDEDPTLLNKVQNMSSKEELLPLLDVPETHRRRTEEDHRTNTSFMEDSDSHAQKVLIHSLAMDDPALMSMVNTPDEVEHVSHQDPNLTVQKHDRKSSTEFELLVDDSVGHAQRVLVHSLSTLPVGDDKVQYGPLVPEKFS
jgi:hypothetical protein